MLSKRTWAMLGVALLTTAPVFAVFTSPVPHNSSPGSPVPPASVREEGLPFGYHQPSLLGMVTPTAYENPTTISFDNGISFDTRKGDPALPAQLKLASPQTGAGYYLVQFNGTITPEMGSDLKSLGAQILDYIPNYAYLVRMNEISRSAVSVLDAVRYVGDFQPAFKLASYMPSRLGTQEIMIYLFRGESMREAVEDLKELGAEIVETFNDKWNPVIAAKVDASKYADIARMPEVRWIEPRMEYTTLNDLAQWVGQDNMSGVRRIWYVNGTNNAGGIRCLGQGQVTGHADTGIYMSHWAFYDASVPINGFGQYPTHRKIIAYQQGGVGATYGDESGHGTHTAGTICGNDSVNSGSRNARCGMAPYAKHWFVDIGKSGGTLVGPGSDGEMWSRAYTGNAGGACRIFSQSFGANASCYFGVYSGTARSWDAFMWDHKDFLGFNAAGNSSNANSINPPGTAKDIVTVGATLNGSGANTRASYSSQGPCRDTRIKPTISCPGDGVTLYSGMYSAQSGTQNGYVGMQGTSMATPNAAGHCALVRQYFTEGWYPTGTQNSANGFIPSAALMKAVLVNSGDSCATMYPNNAFGFGRINLWNTLHFAGTTSNNLCWVADERDGLNTGQYREYTIPVLAGSPIKVALVWTDYPGGHGANPTIVNDLNLQVTDPGATYYRGNQMTAGESTPNPAVWDARNVEEIVRRRAPAAGNWVIRVTGNNCPMGPQDYAIVVTGNLNLASAAQLIVSAVNVPGSPKNALRRSTAENVQVTLKNIGTATATGVAGTLRSMSVHSTLVDSGPKTFGDIAANGGTATQTYRVQCGNTMMCWYPMPFNVHLTAGSVTGDVAMSVPSNLPDSGNQYLIWGHGDNEDYIYWMTALQRAGYRGWYLDTLGLPAFTRPNPLVIFALFSGLDGTPYGYGWAVSDSYALGQQNDNRLSAFLTTAYDSGGVYLQCPEFGYGFMDPTGPQNGQAIRARLSANYTAATMDLEHGITGVRGSAAPFAGFTFTYSGTDTGFNGPQGSDIDGIFKTGTALNLMRFTSQRNDTCLVGNISASPMYRSLVSTWLLRGLVDAAAPNTKYAYADTVMRWFGLHPYPSGVEAGSPDIVLRTDFQVGRPNPTLGAMTFSYQLAKDAKASLKVYNLAGQLVHTLVDGAVPAGTHETVWNGRTDSGKRVPSGVYLVRFEAGDYRATKKAVVVR